MGTWASAFSVLTLIFVGVLVFGGSWGAMNKTNATLERIADKLDEISDMLEERGEH